MKITILGTDLEINNDEGFWDQFDWHVNQVLEDHGLYFSHLVIDGETVSEDYESYIAARLNEIAHVEVKAVALMEILDQALRSGGDYLIRALPEIRKLGNDLYRQPDSETWTKFEQMLEGMEWLLHMLRSIVANPDCYADGADYEQVALRLNEQLGGLNDAVAQKDMVLTGDLILYEIVPLLEDLESRIHQTLSTEVAAAASH